jgi:hypothetical protein
MDIWKGDIMQQTPLFFTPPEYLIDTSYLDSVFAGHKCVTSETGSSHSSIKHVNHPAFTTLRKHLAERGYIHIESNWHNGDVVLHAFKLNDVMFYPGEKFCCASAMKYYLNNKDKYTEKGEKDSHFLPVRLPWAE